MSDLNIIVYTIHPDEWPCEYCDKAKAWLSERGMWAADVSKSKQALAQIKGGA